MRTSILLALGCAAGLVAVAGAAGFEDKFRQLEERLPTPGDQRAASGAPGHKYWQQRADYVIDVELDDAQQRIVGSEVVSYQNNSPDELRYLWMQIDNNILDRNSLGQLSQSAPDFNQLPYKQMGRLLALENFDGSVNIQFVKDGRGRAMRHTVVGTMMRVELDRPLPPGGSIRFSVGWDYLVNDAKKIRFRTGYEFFQEDGNYLYEIAHWYPRMVAYTDVNGWHHKQFVGSGEFTLEFGDFLVRITVPADHIVGATGELQNASRVLTPAQRDRLRRAASASEPVFIVTPDEAKKTESAASKPKGKKTWVFKATNVRDFAFASSRKFIWDAMGHRSGTNRVLAMSFYPNEAEPLWSRYSTQAVVHTLEVYSRYTLDYPYPVAISVNGPVGGMEYPMICFNGPRADQDGTYYPTWMGGESWWTSKYGLIGVVIHEVGHNYFPMIVNSDERQWTWMDEGLNTFLQYLAEQEWEEDFPSWRGEPEKVVEFMTSDHQVPIMTNSESLLQFGNNAYAKPATALNILRETILGREQFDYAFKEYVRRWKFKRPQPADFFRTMEDASGTDLDWFWRGWFYSTDHVDISVEDVRWYAVDSRDPDVEKPRLKKEKDERDKSLSELRNQKLLKRVARYPTLKDFYNSYDEHDVTGQDREDFKKLVEKLGEDKAALLKTPHNFYAIDFANKGGVVMPIPLEIHYQDGTHEEKLLPAELWRRSPQAVSWLLMTTKELDYVLIDRRRQIADANDRNNRWPREAKKTRFQLFEEEAPPSPMKKLKDWEEKKKKEAKEAKEAEKAKTKKIDAKAGPERTGVGRPDAKDKEAVPPTQRGSASGSDPKGSAPKGSAPKGSAPKASAPKASAPKASAPKGKAKAES